MLLFLCLRDFFFLFCFKLHTKPDVMTIGGGGNYIRVRECNERVTAFLRHHRMLKTGFRLEFTFI